MEVYCCCSVAHQPSSAGEKVLFTSITSTMLSTSRTTKSAHEMIVVVFPPLNILPEYLQDHCMQMQINIFLVCYLFHIINVY
jgi:hypothetical protein